MLKRSRTNLIEPLGIPPVGLAISINGQRFELIGHEPHVRQDGALTTLLVWQAECLTCGAGFISRTSVARWAEVRRCELHRQPGKRVKAIENTLDRMPRSTTERTER